MPTGYSYRGFQHPHAPADIATSVIRVCQIVVLVGISTELTDELDI